MPRVPPGPHRHELSGVLAAALAVALVVAWPVLGSPAERVLGEPMSESLSGAWVLWWAQGELSQLRLPFAAPDVGFPDGTVLHALPLLDALLTLPLSWVAGPLVVYNVAQALEVALGFVGAWVFLRERVSDPWAAAPGALAYALAPLALASRAGGNVEVAALGWIPLGAWAIGRAVRDPSLGRVLAAGLLFAASLLTNPYYFVFTALLAAWSALSEPGRPAAWRIGLRALAIGGVALVVVAPQLWTIAASLDHPLSMVDERQSNAVRRYLVEEEHVYDVLSLVLPTRAFEEVSGPQTVYLGLATLALGALGLRRPGAWRWALLAAFAAVFALGGFLELGGRRLTVGGLELALPARFLTRHVPPFTQIHHPYRILPLATLALGVLGARWLDGLGGAPGRRRGLALGFVAAILVDSLLLSPASWPVPTTAVVPPAFYEELAEDPERYGVLDLLEDDLVDDYGAAHVLQATHGKGIPYRLGNLAPWFETNPMLRLASTAPDGTLGPPDPRLCAGARELAEAGVRYLVKHRSGAAEDPRLARIETCDMVRVRDDGEVLAWDLRTAAEAPAGRGGAPRP